MTIGIAWCLRLQPVDELLPVRGVVLLTSLDDLTAPQSGLAGIQSLALDVPSDPEFAFILGGVRCYDVMIGQSSHLYESDTTLE